MYDEIQKKASDSKESLSQILNAVSLKYLMMIYA